MSVHPWRYRKDGTYGCVFCEKSVARPNGEQCPAEPLLCVAEHEFPDPEPGYSSVYCVHCDMGVAWRPLVRMREAGRGLDRSFYPRCPRVKGKLEHAIMKESQ